jgi:hypothetical protein
MIGAPAIIALLLNQSPAELFLCRRRHRAAGSFDRALQHLNFRFVGQTRVPGRVQKPRQHAIRCGAFEFPHVEILFSRQLGASRQVHPRRLRAHAHAEPPELREHRIVVRR